MNSNVDHPRILIPYLKVWSIKSRLFTSWKAQKFLNNEKGQGRLSAAVFRVYLPQPRLHQHQQPSIFQSSGSILRLQGAGGSFSCHWTKSLTNVADSSFSWSSDKCHSVLLHFHQIKWLKSRWSRFQLMKDSSWLQSWPKLAEKLWLTLETCLTFLEY